MATPVRALVVNYNSGAILRECVAALRDAGATSIHVFDNGSSQQLIELGEATSTGVEVTRSAQNLGFGRAVNELVAALPSEDDLIWVVNPDSICSPDALDLMRDAIESGRADVAMPLITSHSGSEIWFAGGEVDARRGRTTHWWYQGEASGIPQVPFETELITGASFMLSRRRWNELGGFEPSLFLYWEDALLSIRSRERGLRCLVIPAARVRHDQGTSSGGGPSPTYYYYMQRNRLLTARLLGLSTASVVAGAGLRETVRLLVSPLWESGRGRLQRTQASARGLAAGIRGKSGPR